MIVVRVGDLVVPLTCKRCGYRVPVIVGDDASEAAGCVAMAQRRAEKRRAAAVASEDLAALRREVATLRRELETLRMRVWGRR